MPVIPLQEASEPFFLLRLTPKEYPLAKLPGRRGGELAEFLILREPGYYRQIEEKGKKDTEEATAILEARLECRIDSEWVHLPTTDGRIRMLYNTGYLLCMSYVVGEVPTAKDLGRFDQASNLTDIINNTAHLSLADDSREWWVNVLSASAAEFATVLEKDASRQLQRSVTVCHGPVNYYDKESPPHIGNTAVVVGGREVFSTTLTRRRVTVGRTNIGLWSR